MALVNTIEEEIVALRAARKARRAALIAALEIDLRAELGDAYDELEWSIGADDDRARASCEIRCDQRPYELSPAAMIRRSTRGDRPVWAVRAHSRYGNLRKDEVICEDGDLRRLIIEELGGQD